MRFQTNRITMAPMLAAMMPAPRDQGRHERTGDTEHDLSAG
jgi:hypothetical protein